MCPRGFPPGENQVPAGVRAGGGPQEHSPVPPPTTSAAPRKRASVTMPEAALPHETGSSVVMAKVDGCCFQTVRALESQLTKRARSRPLSSASRSEKSEMEAKLGIAPIAWWNDDLPE